MKKKESLLSSMPSPLLAFFLLCSANLIFTSLLLFLLLQTPALFFTTECYKKNFFSPILCSFNTRLPCYWNLMFPRVPWCPYFDFYSIALAIWRQWPSWTTLSPYDHCLSLFFFDHHFPIIFTTSKEVYLIL